MISTMHPDIDHADEYVRNTTARAFSVVASALGIPSLLPFLKAVCCSKKSWQTRNTGIRIVQQNEGGWSGEPCHERGHLPTFAFLSPPACFTTFMMSLAVLSTFSGYPWTIFH